ncbi:MAG: T9SS type A sorting domain-containing protein [Bacteroidetes bacterium]|nr:T9SS type A sorting domain-containing protein [Bacteroidota bacterium]MCL1969251.1 T9SS type A sorting domain-containing protein [Bacteroidota bacterium]
MKKYLFFFVAVLCLVNMTMHAQQRKVLFEQFTSSTCGPCAQMNAWLNPLLVTNADKVVIVRYQMNWPGSGDPYYTAEGGVRRSYYGVNSVPYPLTNGVYTSNQSAIQNAINTGYAQPAQATIEGYFSVIGNTIYVKASVTPLISGDNHFIHCIVNEKRTVGNIRTNGETEFFHVMMKMFPSGSGTTLNLTEGTTIPLNFSHDMSTTHVEEMSDLEVVVFVQNKSTKAVLNAEYLMESTAIPLPPSNLTASQAGETLDINLSWTSLAGASGYNIYRNGVKMNTTPVTETTYQDIVSEYGTTYNYAVAAVVNNVEGFWATTTVLTNLTIPAPINVTVKQIRGKKMLISWEMPTGFNHPVKYSIYRNGAILNPGNPMIETMLENTGPDYKEYCFEIKPILNSLTGTVSTSTCVTLIRVSMPTNLTAKQVSGEEKDVLLTWEASSNAVGYNIYRDNVQINTELVTSLEYTDVVPEFDMEYTYQVYGVASTGGESESGGTVRITLTYSFGIDEQDNTLFAIYPNPVSGTLKICTEEQITDCQIFNLQGQLVYSTKFGIKEIATDNWTSGIYIIRITTEKGVSEKQFVKN